jgi:hypothetical protein
LFGLLEKVKDLVIVSFNEGALIVIEDCDVGLEGLHNVSEKAIVLHNVFLEFAVDGLEIGAVVVLSLAFELHDRVDGLDESVLKLTGGLYALYLLVQLHPLHHYYSKTVANDMLIWRMFDGDMVLMILRAFTVIFLLLWRDPGS